MNGATAAVPLWWSWMAVAWNLVIGWVFWKLPEWTRRRHLFGYTLPPGGDLDGRRTALVRWYGRWCAACCLLWTLAALGAGATGRPLVAQLTPVGLIASCVVLYLAARGRVRRRFPEVLLAGTAAVEAAAGAPPVSLPRPALPGGLLGQAGPYLLPLAAGGWLALRWQSLAERIPVHYDLTMRPDAWTQRSMTSVFGALLVCLVTVAGLHLGACMMRSKSRPPATAGDVERLRLGLAAMLAAEYLLAATFSVIALTPLLQPRLGSEGMLLLLLAPSSVGGLVLVVWLLYRASRLPKRAEDATDRMEDRYWKAGLLYVNPDDPAVFVEKRFGVGYTLNFGRAGAWWFLVAIVGVPLVCLLALAWLA